MTTFADNVTTLLTTYDNCLALLKSFKRSSRTGTSSTGAGTGRTPSPDPDAQFAVAAQSQLRRSIRSDRTRISRVYRSRLNQSGSLLEKGDARARSSLRRVLRRLSAALTRVLRTATGSPEPIIDYQSLASLSNASRIDAIKAIDGLSRRISDTRGPQRQHQQQPHQQQPSKARSVKSQSSMKSDASSPTSQSLSSSGKEKGTKSRKKGKEKTNTKVKKENNSAKSAQKKTPLASPEAPKNQIREGKAEKGNEKPEQAADEATTLPPETPASGQATSRTKLSSRGRTTPASPKRISIASFASDSTKLGEVSRLPGLETVVDEEFDIRPVYPLRPYAPTAPERKKGFWSRLAGRS